MLNQLNLDAVGLVARIVGVAETGVALIENTPLEDGVRNVFVVTVGEQRYRAVLEVKGVTVTVEVRDAELNQVAGFVGVTTLMAKLPAFAPVSNLFVRSGRNFFVPGSAVRQ